jgi:transposase InsO family protein
VFFVLDLSTRRVEIAGIVPAPHGMWMSQVARNLVDEFDGFLKGKRHLIHDRDPLYTRDFRALLSSAGVKSVRLPARSPNLNAHAERFVLSIKSECLDRMVLLGEMHLRTAVAEYMGHYHRERSHQGLGNRLIQGEPQSGSGSISCDSRLGGLLNHYEREAA